MNHNFEKLNIAIVTETYPPEVNGVSHTIFKIIESLTSYPIQIQLIRPKQKKQIQHTNQNIISIEVNSMSIPMYKELRIGFPCISILKKLWHQSKPNIIHIITEGPLGWAAIKVAKQLHIPIISDYHTNFDSYSTYYKLPLLKSIMRRYLKFIHNQTQLTLVPTHELKDQLHHIGYKNINVLGRGIDTVLFNPSKRNDQLRFRWYCNDETLVFLYVGRIAPEKNIDLAMNTYLEIEPLIPNSKMVVVGDGPLKTVLEKKYPKIIFSGMKKGEDLAQHYASSDIFLSPSITETFGNTILEAMASQLAIVAYNYASAKVHLVHHQSAMLAKYKDSDDFTHQTKTLAFNDTLITNLRHQAWKKSQLLSWKTITSGLVNIYSSHLKLRKNNDALNESKIFSS